MTITQMPSATSIWLAAEITDMRKSFTGLSSIVQNTLEMQPLGGHLFLFSGRRGDRMKIFWWDGTGLCLFTKRLERGRFIWPQANNGALSLSSAQLPMLLEGIDWRHTVRTAQSLCEV